MKIPSARFLIEFVEVNGMIHINNGVKRDHEWITHEEFNRRFPDLSKQLNKESDNPLRRNRIRKGVTLRRLSYKMGRAPSEVTAIERSLNPSTADVEAYIIALQKCEVENHEKD